MNQFVKLLTLALALLVSSSSEAALLVLRDNATQHGSLIRLGDVADISAATSAEVERLASTPLFPAPAPGTVQFLAVAKLRDLLMARGIELNELTIKGSLLVEIGEATPVAEAETTVATQQLSAADTELLVKRAIQQLLDSTSTTSRWRVELKLSKTQLKRIESLGTNWTAHELQAIRSGRVRFQLRGDDTNGGELQLPVEITKIQSVVVTKQPIARGQLVRAVDVEVRDREGNLPGGTLNDLEQVIGKVALRSFKANETIQQNYLRASWQVRRGETVDAYVRTGNIVVRTRAIAKQNGAIGDLIAVETLENKKRLDVTVSGPGQVTIYATGGRAADYATLNRQDTLRR